MHRKEQLKQSEITEVMESLGKDFKTDIINTFKGLRIQRREIGYMKRINKKFQI